MNLTKQQATGMGSIARPFPANSLFIVAAITVVIVATAVAWALFGATPGPLSAGQANQFADPALIEFRHGERAVGAAVAPVTHPLIDQALIEFRQGERGAEVAPVTNPLLDPALIEFRQGER